MDKEDMESNQASHLVSSSPASSCIQNNANSNQCTSAGIECACESLGDIQPPSHVDGLPLRSSMSNSEKVDVDIGSSVKQIAPNLHKSLHLNSQLPQVQDEEMEGAHDSHSDRDCSSLPSTEKNEDNVHYEPSEPICSSQALNSYVDHHSDHPNPSASHLTSTESSVVEQQESSSLISSSPSEEVQSFPKALQRSLVAKEIMNVEDMQNDSVKGNVVKCEPSSVSSTTMSTSALPCDMIPLPGQSHTHQSTSLSSETMDTSEDTPVLNSSPFALPVIVSVQNQLSSTTSNTTAFLTSSSTSVVGSASESVSSTNTLEKMIPLVATSELSMRDDSKDESSEQEIDEHEKIESGSKEVLVSQTPTSWKNEDISCKILTKYIFINKPAKAKAGKKKLGFLYKQAFRHYQRSRAGPSIGKNFSVIEKNPLKKDKKEELRSKSSTVKKRKNGKNKTQKKQNNKSKRKGGKTGSKTTARKSVQKAKENTEESTNCRKSRRKRVKRISALQSEDSDIEQFRQAKVKSKKRRVLSLSEKVDIIKQLESPSASFSAVAKNFNVSKSYLARILKQKAKFLGEFEEKERKKSKMKEKLEKRKNLHKVLAIKEERPDHDTTENDIGMNLPCPDDLNLDPASSAFFNKSIANRNRKELTLQEKVWMIRELEKPGAKNRHIAKKFGVSCSAVSRIRKGKEALLSRALSGDVCQQMRRSRECKDPVLDRALLKWYRSVEALKDHPISISNTLLQDKARDLAIAMGTSYYPSVNWIIRWKYRHNIRCKSGRIDTKEALDELDANVDIADIITAVEGQVLHPNIKTENNMQSGRPDKLTICEHCGIMIRRKRDRRCSNHLKTCPLAAQSHRRDLTLGEKAQVVRALEKPGVKMITLAKKYGVSSSAISRIHKNRVDILARCAGAYVNVRRKRERPSKEPEVERSLCDWYCQQQEYGYHVSGATIREKAHEIAALMGKDFSPSDSWVFRWRHRNNVNAISGFDEIEDGNLSDEVLEEKVENSAELSSNAEVTDKDTQAVTENGEKPKEKKRKRKGKAVKVNDNGEPLETVKIKLPLSVMCEKCGCVSERLKNNRICSMRHAKGCPDLKPRNELTYEERVKMLKALEEPGATLSSVARQFGVSASSMSRMNQKKSSILTHGMDYAGQKRIRDCKEPEVAKLLYMWFTEKQKEGVHVTGAKLKEKAADFAQDMGREFKASTGWLGRWKHRYNIIFRQKDESKIGRDLSKKKIQKRKSSTPFKQEEEMETTEENNQDVSAPSVITIMPDESQPLQPPRMFLNQRYQTPWTINHQPSTSCARPKDFMTTPNHGVPDESLVPYAYDHMPRPVFHNVFENFAGAANYPVSMVEASVPVRDYIQPVENEAHQPSSTHHTIIPHQPPPLNLHATGLAQHHPAHHHQHPLHQSTHSTITSGSVGLEDESVHLQQQQIMEACRLMNSFAKEKSLGEHVHAALRTIEMTLKNNERKGPPRTSYTNI